MDAFPEWAQKKEPWLGDWPETIRSGAMGEIGGPDVLAVPICRLSSKFNKFEFAVAINPAVAEVLRRVNPTEPYTLSVLKHAFAKYKDRVPYGCLITKLKDDDSDRARVGFVVNPIYNLKEQAIELSSTESEVRVC